MTRLPSSTRVRSSARKTPPASRACRSTATIDRPRRGRSRTSGKTPTPPTYGGTTLYSHLNGGLKRFRVAKAQHGKWVNTWMNADEASWINDTDYDRIGARIAQFAKLLGD